MTTCEPSQGFHEKYWFWLLIAGILTFFLGIILAFFFQRVAWWFWVILFLGVIMISIATYWGYTEIKKSNILEADPCRKNLEENCPELTDPLQRDVYEIIRD